MRRADGGARAQLLGGLFTLLVLAAPGSARAVFHLA